MYKYDIAASIVAYKNDPEIINNAIKSFINTDLEVGILIVDNSPSDTLKAALIQDPRVFYTHNKRNVGFSKAHNQGIKFFSNSSKYFLVLNPDVYFNSETLPSLFNYLEKNPLTGLIAPKVLYPNGDIQISRRLIPNPLDLLLRRLPFEHWLSRKRSKLNEYHDLDAKCTIEVPFLLGCFMLFRSSDLEKTGLFDERYFMYLEDLDLCRRMRRHAKVVYYGKVHIYHLYQRASSKNLKMLVLHTISVIKYFNKWGWLKDNEREQINLTAIALLQANKESEEVTFSRKYAATL